MNYLGISYDYQNKPALDESFLPFAESEETQTVIRRLKSGRKIAALRSFTKIFGMPGLRLGVLVTGDRQWSEALSGCTQPWPISLPAQLAGEAALDEKDFITATTELITAEREYLFVHLEKAPALYELHKTDDREYQAYGYRAVSYVIRYVVPHHVDPGHVVHLLVEV